MEVTKIRIKPTHTTRIDTSLVHEKVNKKSGSVDLFTDRLYSSNGGVAMGLFTIKYH